MPSLTFIEQMAGNLNPTGRFEFRLHVNVSDVERFLENDEPAQCTGWIDSDAFGGRRDVLNGTFTGPPGAQRFHLEFRSADGRLLAMDGHKSFEGGLNPSVLAEVHENGEQVSKGDIRQPIHWLLQATTSMRASGASFFEKERALAKYRSAYMETTWNELKPKSNTLFTARNQARPIPLFTLEGVRDAETSTHYLATPDGLGLSLLRFRRAESNDVVVVMHGLTTSTDMFIMPEHYNLVSYLLDQGFGDVFSFDWRGSMRHSYDLFPAKFTLDDIAMNDMPAAIAKIREVAGDGKRIHVICHCVGSICFTMSMAAGLIHGVSSVVSNSVSLTPEVPKWSAVKLQVAPALVSALNFPYVNPRWGYGRGQGAWLGRVLATFASLFHPECDNPACHMVSFMWGSGRPACFLHENLDPVTHDRLGDLFGAVNPNYYIHVRRMARDKRARKLYPKNPAYSVLPDDYLEAAKRIQTPILFVTGDMNRVFPHSNILTYESLKASNSKHELKVVPGYGHQDVFQGKNCAIDTFPFMAEFIRQHS